MMNLDPAAASLMLRGRRKMTNQEAHQISTIIGQPLNEILRQAGIDVVDDVSRVPITSTLDAHGSVTLMPRGTYDTVLGPADCPIGTHAIQVRSPATSKDGWLLFIDPNQGNAADNLERLCSAAVSTGKQVCGIVKRGYRRDTHNVILWPSNEILSDVVLAWASPVLWVKP